MTEPKSHEPVCIPRGKRSLCLLLVTAFVFIAAVVVSAQTLGQNDPPFVRAFHALAGTDNNYPIDYRLARQLVIADPSICSIQDVLNRNEGPPTRETLLMLATHADSQTFNLILSKTNNRFILFRDRNGKDALVWAGTDWAAGGWVNHTDYMNALWVRYKRAKQFPNVSQDLFRVVSNAGSPSLISIRWLMAHGANPRWQTSDGYTIIDIARSNCVPAVVNALQGN